MKITSCHNAAQIPPIALRFNQVKTKALIIGPTGSLLPPPFLLWSYSLLFLPPAPAVLVLLFLEHTRHAPVSRFVLVIAVPGMFVSQIASPPPSMFKSLSKCYFLSKTSKSTLFKIVGYYNHILYPLAKYIFPLDSLSSNNCKFNLFCLLSVFPLPYPQECI